MRSPRHTWVVTSTSEPGARRGPDAAAAPERVRVVLDRLGESVAGIDDVAHGAVVAVAAASDSLGDFVAEDEAALRTLCDLDSDVALDTSGPDRLRRSHRCGLLRIAARDLLGLDDLPETVAALSALTTRSIEAGLGMAGADSLVVVGMGKYGAGELNFVSDVDLLFVSDDDPTDAVRAVRTFLDVVGRCFRVDTDLRPEGRDGPLVRSMESYRAHWERWASAWEFQALLKASTVAGPADLRSAFDEAAGAAVWSRSFGESSLREIRRMKARSEAEIAKRGLTDREVKRGRGGIRDIEFSVQLLQLVHGGADQALRVPATLAALQQLSARGYVDEVEAATLDRAYRFLRRVEHRLQLVQERQTHTVPEDRQRRRRIARSLGYRGDPERGATDHFDRDLAMHRLAVRRVHDGWYFRPLLDAFASGDAAEMTATRLAAFGFRDPARTEQAVRELSRGLTRSSGLMRQLLPLVLDWLSQGPDPDLGLLGLRRLLTGEQRVANIVPTFRDSAETARALCVLLATAPVATELLEANPDLIERLDDPARLQTGSRDDLVASAWDATGWRDGDDRQASLQRWFRRHLLGIVARDVIGASDVDTVGADLSTLAEVVIETALRMVDPQVPFAVIGMGRLGGRTLAYGSDVDLVYVYDGEGSAAREEAERAAAEVTRLLRGASPAARIVDVDIDLRPEGTQGPLARSLDSYTVYLRRWAEVWERHALLRARGIAGDDAVLRGFDALREHAAWTRPPSDDDRREVRRLKARGETERLPGGLEPWRHCKLGPGGLVDVEWTVQLLQWESGTRGRATLPTLEHLVERGVVERDDAVVLDTAHRWCDALRNRLWLVLGEPDVVPTSPDRLVVLARSFDTDATSLVERHRRNLRRSRRVVERLFYGAR